MKLLILDRDGVINEDSDAYIKSLDEWTPIPGSVAAIARLSQAGWTVAVATNQSGLARGYYDEATLESMHTRLRQLVAEQGGEVGLIVHCPHGPDDGCSCRKPLPGMLEQIAAYYGVDGTGDRDPFVEGFDIGVGVFIDDAVAVENQQFHTRTRVTGRPCAARLTVSPAGRCRRRRGTDHAAG